MLSKVTARKTLALRAVSAIAATLVVVGCASAPGASGSADPPVVLRLGFLANITHASALVGVEKGIFARDLGRNVRLRVEVFSNGSEEATALLAGQLDAAYVGPNPAISAWQKSGGKAIKIISGAEAGGASLVVKRGIASAAGLKGESLATPALGGTQDVALRYWLKQHGLKTSTTGGGDVPIKPMAPNSAAVLAFASGQIAGGFEPSPYDVEMLKDGGTRLVSMSGVTTILVVTQAFLKAHSGAVSGLLKGQVQANDYIHKDLAGAEQASNAELTRALGKGISPGILPAAFKEITFTDDPDASSLAADVQQAVAVGLLKPLSLNGIYDLGPLNRLLKAAGEPQVKS